jgi:hypothetical protein
MNCLANKSGSARPNIYRVSFLTHGSLKKYARKSNSYSHNEVTIHQGIEAMAELIGNERVDDIPLLLSQMEKLNLSGLADEHFNQHGNWQGLSLRAISF